MYSLARTMEFKVVKINQNSRTWWFPTRLLSKPNWNSRRKKLSANWRKARFSRNCQEYHFLWRIHRLGRRRRFDSHHRPVLGPCKRSDEVVELDQKLNVVILDFDDEKKRIALGLKQLTPHPWDALDPNLKVGDHVKGKVVVMADYGAFIEILRAWKA